LNPVRVHAEAAAGPGRVVRAAPVASTGPRTSYLVSAVGSPVAPCYRGDDPVRNLEHGVVSNRIRPSKRTTAGDLDASSFRKVNIPGEVHGNELRAAQAGAGIRGVNQGERRVDTLAPIEAWMSVDQGGVGVNQLPNHTQSGLPALSPRAWG
jgi:hypothetical protein